MRQTLNSRHSREIDGRMSCIRVFCTTLYASFAPQDFFTCATRLCIDLTLNHSRLTRYSRRVWTHHKSFVQSTSTYHSIRQTPDPWQISDRWMCSELLPFSTWTYSLVHFFHPAHIYIFIQRLVSIRMFSAQGNILSNVAGQCCHQQATRWDTGPMTDLKYPDRNVLPIFNRKVPKQQSLGKIAQQHYTKSWPAHHHLNSVPLQRHFKLLFTIKRK